MALTLSLDQLRTHPEFPHITWPLEPKSSGKVKVGQGRSKTPYGISWEVHGEGETKMVWITGLASNKWAWQRQTRDFGHTQGSTYSSLIFDNRGMGDSDKPFGRYTTLDMAKDVVELLDHLGWTGKRQLNIVGISMGGMIAQELALLIPDRIASLALVSSAARITNTVGWLENLRNRINLLIPRDVEGQIRNQQWNIFTDEYLKRPDELEYVVEPFPTNADRLAAGELAKRSNPERFTRTGFMCQVVAANWHNKSAAQLEQLADAVGRDRILVMHGGKDRMITFPHGEVLLRELGGEDRGVTKAFFEGDGHVIPIERRKDFNEVIEKLVNKAKAL